MCTEMEQNYRDGVSEEPTIRFTIDPTQISKAREGHTLEDTYVGEPLLPRNDMPSGRGGMPGWSKAAIACAAIVGILLGVAALYAARQPSADSVKETFLTALNQQDYALLASVTVGDDESELTPNTAAPMFALYQEDAAFREKVAQELEAASSGGLFRVREKSTFPAPSYQVQVSGSRVEVHSNLPGAQIHINGYGAAADADGTAVLEPVLPGSYTVQAVYETAFGSVFHAETTVDVTNPVEVCSLEFDYTSLEIYNSSDMPVQIMVEGQTYATVAPEQELVLEPIAPEAEVTAAAGEGGQGERTLSVQADEGYFYVSFSPCWVEIYNEYAVPMEVTRGDGTHLEIQPEDMLTLEEVPPGESLTMMLAGVAGLEPVVYQAEYDFDYLYPVFSLDGASRAEAEAAAMAYAAEQALYDADASANPGMTLLPDGIANVAVEEDGTLAVSVLLLPAEIPLEGETQQLLIHLNRQDGQWLVVEESN